MDVIELHRRAVEGFGRRVNEIADDQWGLGTPDGEWDVRQLLNHVVNESLWTPPLMHGSTIEEVGDRFDGDLLGDDPVRAWDHSVAMALEVMAEPGAAERTVHLSYGEAPASEYILQLFADYLVHGWDLAQSIGADDKLDPELVQACSDWFMRMESAYRSAGAIAERPEVSPDADAQTHLLAMFGRSPSITETLSAMNRFGRAFAHRDVDEIMATMTDDCVFESTGPAPDGVRAEGQEAVRAVWNEFFENSPNPIFQIEELVISGDRATQRWLYRWNNPGDKGHVRGVDVCKVRDGKIAEKLSYVKG
jgi:uncharacterized protein (TIGR03086 family)